MTFLPLTCGVEAYKLPICFAFKNGNHFVELVCWSCMLNPTEVHHLLKTLLQEQAQSLVQRKEERACHEVSRRILWLICFSTSFSRKASRGGRPARDAYFAFTFRL
uniref:Uncharacterized protein n=1 Tax=Hyaloperonospora arabidopsidis (strain Emoy2) TaxID=559515 RepID=M4BHY9_HYAAE